MVSEHRPRVSRIIDTRPYRVKYQGSPLYTSYQTIECSSIYVCSSIDSLVPRPTSGRHFILVENNYKMEAGSGSGHAVIVSPASCDPRLYVSADEREREIFSLS